MTIERRILITESPDAQGIIAKVTTACFKHQLNIIKNSEFVDHEHNRFFMRTELEGCFDNSALMSELKSALPDTVQHRLLKTDKKRIVVLVTKEAHCLGELLMKSTYGSLNADIVGIIGNHNNLSELANKFDIPFHHISHVDTDRQTQEDQLKHVIDSYNPSYIVLAKYMRILTPEFVGHFNNRIINIHHSFLPAFIGAKPYHQAYKRGVKVIGATAHFVNNDLDEGPIITQDVTPIDHRYTAEQMVQAGRDVEESVLTHALQKVLDEKVFIYANRTVVFD